MRILCWLVHATLRQGGPGMKASAAYTRKFARAIMAKHIASMKEPLNIPRGADNKFQRLSIYRVMANDNNIQILIM